MKFACRDIRYITDPLTRHEKTFLKSFLSGVYAGVIIYTHIFYTCSMYIDLYLVPFEAPWRPFRCTPRGPPRVGHLPPGSEGLRAGRVRWPGRPSKGPQGAPRSELGRMLGRMLEA